MIRIHIRNKKEAVNFKPSVDNAKAISISTPGDDYPKLDPGFFSILFMRFHDIEKKRKESDVPFDEKMAQHIIHFVDPLKKGKGPCEFLVHCDAGISRSSAVAFWINEYFPYESELIHLQTDQFSPNMLVMNTLRRESGLVPIGAKNETE